MRFSLPRLAVFLCASAFFIYHTSWPLYQVDDRAGIFRPETRTQVTALLKAIWKKHGVHTVVRTFRTDGDPVEVSEAMLDKDKRHLGEKSIVYYYEAKKGYLFSRAGFQISNLLGMADEQTSLVKEIFVAGLEQGHPNEGLVQAIEFLASALDEGTKT